MKMAWDQKVEMDGKPKYLFSLFRKRKILPRCVMWPAIHVSGPSSFTSLSQNVPFQYHFQYVSLSFSSLVGQISTLHRKLLVQFLF